MATINYIIRSPRKDETTVSVWASVFISRSEKGERIQFQVNTHQKIQAGEWNAKEGRCKIGADTRQQAINDTTNKRLDELRKALLGDIQKYDTYNSGLAAEVISKYRQESETIAPSVPIGIVEFVQWLVRGMEQGSELNKGKKYGLQTIKQYRQEALLLERFCKYYAALHGAKPTWSDYGKRDVAIEYMRWLDNNCDFLPATRNKHVSQIQSLLKIAAREHLHNHEGWKLLYQIPEDRDEARTKVYLTNAEIDALYDMRFEKGSWRCIIRDIFLAGCFTGQRISDYGRLSADCFRTTERGTRIVELRQTKTGKHVCIPILDDRLLTIAERYDGNFPKVWPQDIGRDIKLILKDLSGSVPSLAVKYPTVLTLPEKRAEEAGKIKYERDKQGRVIMPKWALVSTHTARRSCITNLYKTHLFTDRQIMSISGHSSLQTFYGYVLESDREIAEEITAKMAEFRAKKGNEDLF